MEFCVIHSYIKVSIWEVTLYLFSWMPTINLNGVIKTFTEVNYRQRHPGSDHFTVSHINKDIYYGLHRLGCYFGGH